MGLNSQNYYTEIADYEYMSVSQFKDFFGTYGRRGCEARAMAKLKGEYVQEPTTAMLVGSYVDTYFEGTGTQFQAEHPEIFRNDGKPKAQFMQAEQIIKRIEADPLFMKYLSGQKQVIMTGELFGVPWKIKMDSYLDGLAIVDLKIMQSLTDLKYVRDIGYLDFVRYWGYDIQGAAYQEIVYQNTGKRLPFYIAGASKEEVTNIEIIHLQDSFLQEALGLIEYNAPRYQQIKRGEIEPERCESCDYCRRTKILTAPIGIADLIADL